MNIRDRVEMKFKADRELQEAYNKLKREKILSQYPDLKEIMEEMKDVFTKSLSFDMDAVKEYDRLIEKRDELIEKYDLKAQLEYQYNCPLCKDTGYLAENEMCSCLSSRLVEEYFKIGESSDIIKNYTFDTFHLDIFSEKEYKEETKSPKENMEAIFKLAKKYADSFNKNTKEGLFFYGESGTGKTFLTGAIVNEIMKKGYSVLYMTAIELMDIYKSKTFTNYKEKDEDESRYQLTKKVDLLVIDDLGTEMDSPFTQTGLFDIINHRTATGKPMLINSNFSLLDLSKRYADRIFSRISGSAKFVKFYGENLRYKR